MRSTLETLRDNTNFFGAYLGDDGFGAERAIYGIIDATGYNAEVDTSLLKNALNRDLLLAGEGLELSLEDLLTFDPFYLLEKLKLSRARIFIVWKSESSFPPQSCSGPFGYDYLCTARGDNKRVEKQ